MQAALVFFLVNPPGAAGLSTFPSGIQNYLCPSGLSVSHILSETFISNVFISLEKWSFFNTNVSPPYKVAFAEMLYFNIFICDNILFS